MFKPRTIKSAGQCGRAMHAPTGLIDITISSVEVGAHDDPFARRNLTKSLLQWEKVPRNEADEVSLI